MSNYSNFCYYYEYLDHYMGSDRKEVKIPISKLDEMAEKYGSKDDADQIDYEEWLDETNAYAIGEVLRNWKDIRTKLETKGIWGAEWEEGSHAISMDSMADARNTVGQLEIQVFERCGEW